MENQADVDSFPCTFLLKEHRVPSENPIVFWFPRLGVRLGRGDFGVWSQNQIIAAETPDQHLQRGCLCEGSVLCPCWSVCHHRSHVASEHTWLV